MAEKVSGVTVKIGADTSAFKKEMQKLQAEARTISKDMKNVNDAMQLDPNSLEKAADKLKLLREACENAKKKVDFIKESIDNLNKTTADKSTDKYKKALEKLERQLESANREQEVANARLNEFENHADLARVSASKFADVLEGTFTANTIMIGLQTVLRFAKSIADEFVRAAKALAEFSKEAVMSAAEYEDAIGYSETVFGDSSGAVLDWAKNNSEGLRISQKTLTQYMNTLGQVFRSQGLDESKQVSMVENLMSLAADIRAATGKSTDDILPTMMRGFTTSVKNFRQFGVIMTDAEVKAYALANGLVQLTVDEDDLAKATANLHAAQKKAQDAMDKYGEGSVELEKAEVALTKAEEDYNEVLGGSADNIDSAVIVQARYMLLLEKLVNIIGQNEKESGLFNSQLALTKTKFENLRDEIGMQLLPIFTELITEFNEFLNSDAGQVILKKIVEQFQKWSDTIGEMMDDGRLETFLNDLIEQLPEIAEDIGNLVTKMLELIPKISELADKFIAGTQQVESFRAKIREVLDLFSLSEWDFLKYIVNPSMYSTQFFTKGITGGLANLFGGHAQGGPAQAGMPIRVNDDAGHRPEIFMPFTDGYVLNGNQTDKIMNNYNNSRNFSGGVQIYVQYSGQNVRAFADQLGQIFEEKTRMSGSTVWG